MRRRVGAVAAGRRRPIAVKRRRAARARSACGGLRATRPGWTIRPIHPRSLRRPADRTVGTTETLRSAAAVRRIALCFPSARGVRIALRHVAVARAGHWSRHVPHRGRRPVACQLPLTGRHRFVVGHGCRAARAGRCVQRRCALARSSIHWTVYRAVHRRVACPTHRQMACVDRPDRHMRSN